MKYAVIQTEAGKPAAIIAHDTESGRTVIKCKDSDWALQAALDYWVERPLIVQVSEKLGGSFVQVRKKIVRFDEAYLGHLLDRVVMRPYSVRSVLQSKSTKRLDSFLDDKAKETLK